MDIAHHIGYVSVIAGMDNTGRRTDGHHHVALLHSIRVAQLDGLHLFKLLAVHLGRVHTDHGQSHNGIALLHNSSHHGSVRECHLNGISCLHGLVRRENQNLGACPGYNHPGELSRCLDGIVKPVLLMLDGMDHHQTVVRVAGNGAQVAVQFI